MLISEGTRLGRYEIRSPLGAGGMGEVYLAWDMTELERAVAIKVLPAELASDQERLHRFMQEAKTASSLNHPNILTIYEIGESDSIHFIVAEFIDGDTLRHRLFRSALGLDEALDVAIQVGSALVAAHKVKIAHRDIKPENIMVRRDGIVKVLDFGLAKLTESPTFVVDSEATTRALVNTVPGTLMGTINYMSPEQARGKDIDARTDIWSIGVVVYEMLTGRLPFSGETTSDLLAAILMSEAVPPKHFNPKVPAEVERIVLKALRKDREERYQTAKDLLIDLRQVKKQLEFAAELGRTEFSRKKDNAESETSIAVLPFVNISHDQENEYFCEGLAEELLSALAKIEGLKVAARTSAFSFKSSNLKVNEIAQVLQVNTILEGSVRKTDNRLRISVQLINAADGYHLWSERYDREMGDLFDLQDEVAKEIAKKLRLKLRGTEENLPAKRCTDNTEAYLLYLKGRFHLNKRTSEGLKESIKYFGQATEADADYALAHAGLADSYLLLGIFGESSARETMPKAKAAATMAMRIDSTLAEACASLGYVRTFYDWDWAAGEEQFTQAMEMNPDYPTAAHYYSFYLAAMGRLDEAIAVERRAQRLDPMSLIINTNIGRYLYYARRYDQAIEQCRTTLDMDPSFFPARVTLGLAYEQKGLYEEAIAQFQDALNNYGRDLAMESLGHAYALSGKRSESLALIEELMKQSARRYVSPHSIANIYLGLGEKDETFIWLDKAYQDRTPWMVFIKIDPRFDSVRSDSRYAELLKRIGL